MTSRTLNLVHSTGDAHPFAHSLGNRRFFLVKIDGKAYKDHTATSQQAAIARAFIRRPLARSIVVRSPR